MVCSIMKYGSLSELVSGRFKTSFEDWKDISPKGTLSISSGAGCRKQCLATN